VDYPYSSEEVITLSLEAGAIVHEKEGRASVSDDGGCETGKDPSCSGMGPYCEAQNHPRKIVQNNTQVDRNEPPETSAEHIHGPHLMGPLGDDLHPVQTGLKRRWGESLAYEDPSHRTPVDENAQTLQLSGDPLIAPQRVFPFHPTH